MPRNLGNILVEEKSDIGEWVPVNELPPFIDINAAELWIKSRCETLEPDEIADEYRIIRQVKVVKPKVTTKVTLEKV
jgi:hypothetical protein